MIKLSIYKPNMYPDDDTDYMNSMNPTSGLGFVGEAAVGVVRVLMMPILMMSIVMMILGMLIYMIDAKSGGFKLAAVGGLLFGGTLFAMDKM